MDFHYSVYASSHSIKFTYRFYLFLITYPKVKKLRNLGQGTMMEKKRKYPDKRDGVYE